MMRCYICGHQHTTEFDIQACQNQVVEGMKDLQKQMGMETSLRLQGPQAALAFMMEPNLVKTMQVGVAYLMNELQLKGLRVSEEDMQVEAFNTMLKNPKLFEDMPEAAATTLKPEQKVQIPAHILKTYSPKFFEGLPPELLAKVPAEVFENTPIDPNGFDPDRAPRDATNRKYL